MQRRNSPPRSPERDACACAQAGEVRRWRLRLIIDELTRIDDFRQLCYGERASELAVQP
jgi:hypothetical protein